MCEIEIGRIDPLESNEEHRYQNGSDALHLSFSLLSNIYDCYQNIYL